MQAARKPYAVLIVLQAFLHSAHCTKCELKRERRNCVDVFCNGSNITTINDYIFVYNLCSLSIECTDNSQLLDVDHISTSSLGYDLNITGCDCVISPNLLKLKFSAFTVTSTQLFFPFTPTVQSQELIEDAISNNANHTNYSRLMIKRDNHSFTDLDFTIASNEPSTLNSTLTFLLSKENVRKADFSYCNLADIADETFDSWRSMEHLNLSFNFIKAIRLNVFRSLERLTVLDLSHNKIQGVWTTGTRHVPIWPVSLLVLNLSYNNFVDESSEKLSCHSMVPRITQDLFLNLDNLLRLDLSGSKSSLMPSVFKPLRSLQYLYLSNSKEFGRKEMFESNMTGTPTDACVTCLATVRHLSLANTLNGNSPVFSYPCALFSSLLLLESIDISNRASYSAHRDNNRSVMCASTIPFRDWLWRRNLIKPITLVNADDTLCNITHTTIQRMTTYWKKHEHRFRNNTNLTGTAALMTKILGATDVPVIKLSATEVGDDDFQWSWQNIRIPLTVVIVIMVAVFFITAPESLLHLRCFKTLIHETETFRRISMQAIKRRSSTEKVPHIFHIERGRSSRDLTNATRTTDVKDIKHDFYTSSLIHGISYAYNSKWLVEKITWYCLVLVFSGIFASDAAHLWVQYQYGDPSTTVSMVNVPRFPQRPFTVCLPVQRRNINFTSDDIKALVAGDICVHEDNNLLIDALAMRIGTQMGWEGTVFKHEPFIPDWMHTLDDELRAQNKTYMQKLQEVSTVLCSRLDVGAYIRLRNEPNEAPHTERIQTLNEIGCKNIFRRERYGITWFDYTESKQTCFRFPGLFEFTGYEIHGDLSFAPFAFFPGMYATIDLNGHHYPKTARQTLLPTLAQMHHKTFILVKIKSHIKNLDYFRNSTQRCHTNCVATTRVREIEQLCKCRPLMWPEHSSVTLPECTLATYKACNLTLKGTVDKCATTVPCEYWEYSTTTYDRGPTLDNSTVIVFGGTNTMFVVYEEVYTRTWHNFLADLGGVLGLWLGGSVMACIHLLVFILKIFYVLAQSRIQQAELRSQVPV